MAGKRKTLGRGLDALLGSSPRDNKEAAEGGDLRFLAIDLLQRGQYQPRHDMRPETLQDLADSIRAQGVVQPIVVRPLAPVAGQPRRYEIIAGERRWRAAQLAGLQEIPAVVRHVDDSAAVAMALIENIQRENLNPLEEAAALTRLITEFDMTHQQAAEAVGRSRAAVSNLLRLLDLAEDVKNLMQERKLEMGHARALLGLPTARQQVEVATVVTRRGLSVRETEAMVRGLLKPKAGKPVKPAVDPDIRALEGELGDKLGARVQIQGSGGGKGKLVIAYNSLDELEGILGHIR